MELLFLCLSSSLLTNKLVFSVHINGHMKANVHVALQSIQMTANGHLPFASICSFVSVYQSVATNCSTQGPQMGFQTLIQLKLHRLWQYDSFKHR